MSKSQWFSILCVNVLPELLNNAKHTLSAFLVEVLIKTKRTWGKASSKRKRRTWVTWDLNKQPWITRSWPISFDCQCQLITASPWIPPQSLGLGMVPEQTPSSPCLIISHKTKIPFMFSHKRRTVRQVRSTDVTMINENQVSTSQDSSEILT